MNNRGFTLVEVMIAIGIIGIVTVVLLVRRNEVVDEARVSKELRDVWMEGIKSASESEVELRVQKIETLPYDLRLESGTARVEEIEEETTEKWDVDKRIRKIWRIDVPILDRQGNLMSPRTIVYYYFPRPK